MKQISKRLFGVCVALLAVGYIGLAAFFLVVNYGDTEGGANIGIGILAILALGAGGVGVVSGLAATIIRIMASRRA
ncbi:hypothetical protein [Curtobacterium luteum]|uniref:hypothetical protein n=1 Tax=Curtobacterium luteum TaxID=33881 RepID=UPI00195D70C9|nr:hypothetical protein [Curtobacterium luteum]